MLFYQPVSSLHLRVLIKVDVEHGFTVPRSETVVVSRATGKFVSRQEYVTQVRDYGNGMWGPVQFTMTEYYADGVVKKSTTLIHGKDFQINVPISRDELTLNIPSGVGVDSKAGNEQGHP